MGRGGYGLGLGLGEGRGRGQGRGRVDGKGEGEGMGEGEGLSGFVGDWNVVQNNGTCSFCCVLVLGGVRLGRRGGGGGEGLCWGGGESGRGMVG